MIIPPLVDKFLTLNASSKTVKTFFVNIKNKIVKIIFFIPQPPALPLTPHPICNILLTSGSVLGVFSHRLKTYHYFRSAPINSTKT